MNVGDCPHLRPGHGCGDRGGGAVRRLDVGDPKNVVGIRDRLVEEEVRAPVHENGQELRLLGDRTQGGRVSTRGDAGEEVNVLRELQPPHLFDVGVGASRFVGLERLDLAFS